jgi:hypothetical protein
LNKGIAFNITPVSTDDVFPRHIPHCGCSHKQKVGFNPGGSFPGRNEAAEGNDYS